MLGIPAFVASSVTLSTSDLFADFCGCRTIDGIRWTSKRTLALASTFDDEDQLRNLNIALVEWIIGECKVDNADKIHSAHGPGIEVIVRGKAGSQVEFGNELFLAERWGGLIVDYQLYGRQAPGEGEKMRESVERIETRPPRSDKPTTPPWKAYSYTQVVVVTVEHLKGFSHQRSHLTITLHRKAAHT